MTTPFQSHHTHSITLFAVNPDFEVVCGGSPRLPHDLLRFEWCILPIFHRSFASEMGRFRCVLVVFRWWKFDQSNFFALIHVAPKHRISLRSQPFSNDSKLSHGWFLVLVHWLSPDSSHAGLARWVAKFHRLYQWSLADQSEVDLWYQNFQNEIE